MLSSPAVGQHKDNVGPRTDGRPLASETDGHREEGYK